MKKALVLLAIVAIAFTSCKKDVINLKEKIIGKWMLAEINERAVTTNDKMVYTFVSPTKAYMSASFTNNPNASGVCNCVLPYLYSLTKQKSMLPSLAIR